MTDRTKHSAEEGWPEVAASLQSWLDALPLGPATPLQPPMTDPRIIALSSNPGQVEPGPFSENDLREQWNAQADEFNQWESLDSSEKLAWAQTRAIAADRFLPPVAKPTPVDLAALHDPNFSDGLTPGQHLQVLWGGPDPRVATTPAPEDPAADQAEGPSLADVDELCAEFGFRYADGETWVLGYSDTLEILQQVITAAITRWRAPVAQPVATPAPQEPDGDRVLKLAAIIKEVDLMPDATTLVLGAAALAEQILAHPGFSSCHDGPAALPAQEAGEGLSDQEIIDLADFDAGFDRYDTTDESGNEGVAWECSNSQLLHFARLVRQGRPAALSAPGLQVGPQEYIPHA